MHIFENRAQWNAQYREQWLTHFERTGKIDWKLYPRVKNAPLARRPGIKLEKSRIVFITSSGAYLATSQTPFDAANQLGDYTVRNFPITSTAKDLEYAHDHFDHSAIKQDMQVLLPLNHLLQFETNGWIGEIAPEVISFMGYQPDVNRLVDEAIPRIVAAAMAQHAEAALLVPA